MYAPAAFKKSGAKAIKVAEAEERSGQDISIDLRGLHTLSGRVTSAEDHHGLNAASLELRSTTNKDFALGGSVDVAGNFAIRYVPPGLYELRVIEAKDTVPDKGRYGVRAKPVRAYDNAKQPISVSNEDVTGITVEVNPSKVQGKGPDEND